MCSPHNKGLIVGALYKIPKKIVSNFPFYQNFIDGKIYFLIMMGYLFCIV